MVRKGIAKQQWGLVSVWERFPIDFTFLHTDHKSTSILDNFFVDEGLLRLVEAASPLHLGDNPSGHAPIMLTLRLPEASQQPEQPDERGPSRLAWSGAEEDQIKRYTASLKER